MTTKIFFGTVESCAIDESENVAVLCFICEKIRDPKSFKDEDLSQSPIPMAAIIYFDSYSEKTCKLPLLSLRTNDRVSVKISRQGAHVSYDICNLTLKQKYQDANMYIGAGPSRMLSPEPHTMSEKIVPAVFPPIFVGDDDHEK